MWVGCVGGGKRILDRVLEDISLHFIHTLDATSKANSTVYNRTVSQVSVVLAVMAKLYTQKYRKEWESVGEFKGWLKPFQGDASRAYCAYCKADFYAKLSDIKNMQSQKNTLKRQSHMHPVKEPCP